MAKLDRHTMLDDGSILFRTGSQLPPWIDGYVQDKGNKYLFRPDFLACVHKSNTVVTMPCGKKTCTHFCKLFQIVITPGNCQSCTKRQT